MPEIIADNISVIQSNELEGATRLEAEYYQSIFLILANKLRKFKCLSLSQISVITDGEHGSPKLDERSGIIYLSGQNIGNNTIDFENVRYCSFEIHKKNQRSAIRNGNVLLSIVGTVGNASVIYKQVEGNTDRNVATIKQISKIFDPYFVSTFLNSKFGKFQTTRLSTGNVQRLLNLLQVKKIFVPLLSENQQAVIKNLVKSAHQKLDQSMDCYVQSEKLLLGELGINNVDLSLEPCYEVNSIDTSVENRIDAEYYQPKYGNLFSVIQKKAKYCRQIREFRSFNARGSQPIYAKEGNLRIINSKHILEQHLDYENFERTHEQNWKLQSEARVFKYDILTYTTGANVGRTNIYFENDKALASNHVNILRLREENPIYVNVVLNSMIGRLQTRRLVTGSAQVELYPGDIDKFIIPFIDAKKQEHISSLVEESCRAKREAKALLAAAKKKVEDMIEKDAK